jgi:hypothetical protein
MPCATVAAWSRGGFDFSTFAALLSEAVSASPDESCERFVMTCGEPGADGGGGDDRAALVGACEEHPSAITIATMAAPSATAALKASIVVVAPLLARTGSIKPYRIAVLARRILDFCWALARRERTMLIPKGRADNDKLSIRGYLRPWSNRLRLF